MELNYSLLHGQVLLPLWYISGTSTEQTWLSRSQHCGWSELTHDSVLDEVCDLFCGQFLVVGLVSWCFPTRMWINVQQQTRRDHADFWGAISVRLPLPHAWRPHCISRPNTNFCLVVCQNSCSVWVLFLALWTKICFLTESHGVCRARLVCYSFLRDQSPTLPVDEYLKTVVVYILSNFLVVLQKEGKSATN